MAVAIAEAVAVASDLSAWVDGLGELARLIGDTSVEALVQSTEKVTLHDRLSEAVNGLCALIWARPALELHLTNSVLEPDDLVILARALRPTVTSLLLENSGIIAGGDGLLF